MGCCTSAGFWARHLLNNALEVYVASEPQAFPMLTPVAAAGPAYARLQQPIAAYPSEKTEVLDLAATDSLYVASPIISDNVRLGTLIMAYTREGFTPRFGGNTPAWSGRPRSVPFRSPPP